MGKENKTADPVASEIAKIDAIKEIIFGQNMRQYDKEFNDLRDYINTNLNAIDKEFTAVRKAIDDLDKKPNAKMESNQQKLLEELAKVDEKKLDRKKLGKMLMDIGEKISS
jgi:hypothetical protein